MNIEHFLTFQRLSGYRTFLPDNLGASPMKTPRFNKNPRPPGLEAKVSFVVAFGRENQNGAPKAKEAGSLEPAPRN